MSIDGASAGSSRRRVFLYGQSLSGVGHYVRTYEIARELARRHDVYLVEGGRLVPRTGAPAGLHFVELPRLVRHAGRIRPLDLRDPAGEDDTGSAFRTRRQVLRGTLARVQPDILVIEYYPFSRWDLTAEITTLLTAARTIRPATKIVCSVRDIPRQTAREDVPPGRYEQVVLERLHQWFDAVMVHGDPNYTKLGEFFPAAGAIHLPVAYTGIVAEQLLPDPAGDARIATLTAGAPYVLVSAGGGGDPGRLLESALAAWELLQARGHLAGHRLVLVPGLGWGPERLARLQETPTGRRALLLEFTPDFLRWMNAAAVSVSCAGYNTCANILETRARAVLVPNPAMPDQAARAALFSRHGFSECLPPGAGDAGALAAAILRSLAGPGCRHEVDLSGSVRSREFLESL